MSPMIKENLIEVFLMKPHFSPPSDINATDHSSRDDNFKIKL